MDIKDVALRYMQFRERSTLEVMKHLKSKNFTQEDIDETILFLKELHYLDDERYAESLMRYGTTKGWGPVRLKQEMAEKGISSEIIQEIIENCEITKSEKQLAMEQAIKLLNRSGIEMDADKEIDERQLAKIGRRLMALGYHTGIIYDVLNKLKKGNYPEI